MCSTPFWRSNPLKPVQNTHNFDTFAYISIQTGSNRSIITLPGTGSSNPNVEKIHHHRFLTLKRSGCSKPKRINRTPHKLGRSIQPVILSYQILLRLAGLQPFFVCTGWFKLSGKSRCLSLICRTCSPHRPPKAIHYTGTFASFSGQTSANAPVLENPVIAARNGHPKVGRPKTTAFTP